MTELTLTDAPALSELHIRRVILVLCLAAMTGWTLVAVGEIAAERDTCRGSFSSDFAGDAFNQTRCELMLEIVIPVGI
jgi:hypothetical protein